MPNEYGFETKQEREQRVAAEQDHRQQAAMTFESAFNDMAQRADTAIRRIVDAYCREHDAQPQIAKQEQRGDFAVTWTVAMAAPSGERELLDVTLTAPNWQKTRAPGQPRSSSFLLTFSNWGSSVTPTDRYAFQKAIQDAAAATDATDHGNPWDSTQGPPFMRGPTVA